jgi:hypothetical protein
MVSSKSYRRIRERRELRDAGVEEEDVDARVLPADFLEEPAHLSRISRVRLHHVGHTQKLRARRCQRLRVASRDDHLRALGGEKTCRRKADARRSARDHRDLARQPAHGLAPVIVDQMV